MPSRPALPRTIGEVRAAATRGDLPLTISVDEALPWLGISRPAAFRAANRSELPCVKLGHRVRVLTVPLLAMLGVDLASDPDNGCSEHER
jgi:hypothetical protein